VERIRGKEEFEVRRNSRFLERLRSKKKRLAEKLRSCEREAKGLPARGKLRIS
jgi:hypothetical protein